MGGTLGNPLRVLVLRDQTPVSGAVVSWTVNVGSVSPHSTTTDASGIAQASWTLGDTIGEQFVTAFLPSDSAVNDTVPVHVSFSAIARPGAPTALVFRPGPSNAFVGRPLNPVVRVAAVDRLGNVATDFHGSVTVALFSDPTGASLTGLTTVNAVDGVATFTDLILDQIGTGYSLIASAAGLPSVTSATFAIVALGSGQIAFVSSRDGNSEIYTMSADGSSPLNLTNNPGLDGSPTWSPDGTRIAFTSNRDGNYEIYVINADGSGLRNLTKNPALDVSPAWSPDGSKIAFISERDGNGEIYVMNADGSGQVNLTNNPANDGIVSVPQGQISSSPVWSPDGSKIAFVSDCDGHGGIYVWTYLMNADGSGQVNFINNPVYGSPVWSPDGSKIAFTKFQICGRCYPFGWILVKADGSGVTQLTSTAHDFSPIWSPDGTRIAFRSVRDGNAEIYVMNADGSGPINITNNPGSDYGPAWRPR